MEGRDCATRELNAPSNEVNPEPGSLGLFGSGSVCMWARKELKNERAAEQQSCMHGATCGPGNLKKALRDMSASGIDSGTTVAFSAGQHDQQAT